METIAINAGLADSTPCLSDTIFKVAPVTSHADGVATPVVVHNPPIDLSHSGGTPLPGRGRTFIPNVRDTVDGVALYHVAP